MSDNLQIIVDNVSKSFKNIKVLNEVSLQVKTGEICGLVGLNGSGKTVLMKIICGLLIPDSGKVIVNGKQIGKDADFPDDTGIIIETPAFMPYMSGFNNLLNLSKLRNLIDKETIKNYMHMVGLDPDDKKWVSNYSLGMRQRLGIAQAIMEDQSILILDEPMNGLDKNGVKEMRKVLLELKSAGKTILLASHVQADIDLLCDSVYEIDGGTIEMIR